MYTLPYIVSTFKLKMVVWWTRQVDDNYDDDDDDDYTSSQTESVTAAEK
jgi:hypothetical protein